MLVIIGPHFLNTLQARVIDMKLYCDDVMGGSTRPRTPTLHTTKLHTPYVFKQSDTIPRWVRYNINMQAIKRIYLPQILQVLYHRLIAPT